ncbi:aliphatic sulfonate ABC transporter substrate-binding protein [Methylocella sp. CPCC 101449]|uniref:aliphatic sulfonate ABC transporter substrate-binding protein n=1 Tax=Methylocella sp. CPCC 101449 TaxID=2987531 RepID=UPI003908B3DB
MTQFSPKFSRRLILSATALMALAAPAFAQVKEIRVDWATYSPLSLVLKEKKLLEKEFAADGIAIRWVFSAGSNKALEFLNAGSLDFGSTAGAAALIGKINGNPIKSIGLYSRPEWTALVTRPDTGITKISDLKGKSVAVTRGTDPHIFLVRALDSAGLTEKDVRLVLLQHPDGKTALIRKDVDAWAGLDPIMAQAEVEDGAQLFYRNAAANTWGVLNTREDFAKQNPGIVRRVNQVYEEARQWAVQNKAELTKLLVAETKLPEAVIAKQLERTDLSNATIDGKVAETIQEAGLALQKAGVIKADVDVKAAVSSLVDTSFAPKGQ